MVGTESSICRTHRRVRCRTGKAVERVPESRRSSRRDATHWKEEVYHRDGNRECRIAQAQASRLTFVRELSSTPPKAAFAHLKRVGCPDHLPKK